jgi:glutathione peroxidase
MSKLLILFIGGILFIGSSIYTYEAASINGGTIDLGQYEGKKIFIVNIATGSGRVSQLPELEQLYQQHKDSMVVIGFPSNSFGNEPLSNEQIESTLRNTYGITFPLAAKVVVAGDSAHNVYKWLTGKDENGVIKTRIRGDFQKYLINSQGKIVGIFDTATSPISQRVQTAIQNNH